MPRFLTGLLYAAGLVSVLLWSSPLYAANPTQEKCVHKTKTGAILSDLAGTVKVTNYPGACVYWGSHPPNHTWGKDGSLWAGVPVKTYWFAEDNTWYVYRKWAYPESKAEPAQSEPANIQAAIRSCVPEMKAYRDEYLRVKRLISLLTDLKRLDPPPEMPDVEICIKGDWATVKASNLARETSEFAGVLLNGFAASGSIHGDFGGLAPGVSVAASIYDMLLKVFAARNDEQMPAAEAFKIYQQYMQNKSGFTKQAMIELQSCALGKVRASLVRAMRRLRDAKNAAIGRIHGQANCLPEEKGRWPMADLERAYRNDIEPKLKAALLATPNYETVNVNCQSDFYAKHYLDQDTSTISSIKKSLEKK